MSNLSNGWPDRDQSCLFRGRIDWKTGNDAVDLRDLCPFSHRPVEVWLDIKEERLMKALARRSLQMLREFTPQGWQTPPGPGDAGCSGASVDVSDLGVYPTGP